MEVLDSSKCLLGEDHPSFGCQKALFLFFLGKNILSVEADNLWAVLCMERLLLVDGKASDNCEVFQVIRNFQSVGTRHERVEEIPFVHFILDIADMDRLLGGSEDDSLIIHAFNNALSDEDRQQAIIKLHALEQNIHNPPQVTLQGKDRTLELTSALVGLGYKKAEVRKFVSSLSPEARTNDLHSLLRQGLKALTA